MKKFVFTALFCGLFTGAAQAACQKPIFAGLELEDNCEYETVTETVAEPVTKYEETIKVKKEAVDMTYVEGVNYDIVTLEPDAIQETPSIVEYVWIACPDCARFTPYLNSYLEKENIENVIVRHSPQSPEWERDARTAYALEEIGRKDVVAKLMDYYVLMNKLNSKPEEIDFINFYNREGVDYKDVKIAEQEQSVQDKIDTTIKEMSRIKITWVPSVVVNNKYKANWENGVDSEEQYIHLINYLKNKD